MAEGSDQEKTEQPTGKRLDEARERGQTPMSREMIGALLFVMALATLQLGAGESVRLVGETAVRFFSLPVKTKFDADDPTPLLREVAGICLDVVSPVFIVAVVAVLLGGFLQIGFRLSLKPLEPKFDKFNPVKGVKKLFGLDNVVTMLQNLVKLALVGTVVYVTLAGAIEEIAGLSGRGLGEVVSTLIEMIFLLGFRVGGGLLAIGFIDLLYRRWKHNKDLMMSKQDVKDESKQADGNPEMKGKIREVQRKNALARMKGEVQEASVVVRNPTHYAVALKYREGDAAPRVVAKGRALMALTIIRIAEESGVEVIVNKPLAREMYRTVKVGEWIPERLFRAVAQILAAIYRKKNRRGGKPSAAAAARGVES
jgi:flagellar biosynthesis protein FlhB